MLFGVEAVTLMSGGQETFVFFDNIDITVNQTPLPAALPLFGAVSVRWVCSAGEGSERQLYSQPDQNA